MPFQHLSDEFLFDQFNTGEKPECYSEIYKRYFVTLSKYAAWQIGDLEKGKDLAQGVLIKLYERPELFDSKKSLKTWLYSVLKNRIKNVKRDEANRNRILSQVPSSTSYNTTDNEKKEKLKSVVGAIDKLSDQHREVFLLKYSSNLTIKEIGQYIGSSEGTVKSRLFYAMKSIKNQVNLNIKR